MSAPTRYCDGKIKRSWQRKLHFSPCSQEATHLVYYLNDQSDGKLSCGLHLTQVVNDVLDNSLEPEHGTVRVVRLKRRWC